MPSAPIDVSASGLTCIVSGQANLRVIVQHWHLKGAGAVNFSFASKTGSAGTPVGLLAAITQDRTSLTGVETIGSAGDGLSSPYAGGGLFITRPGEGLWLNLSAAVQVGGGLTFKLG